MNLNINEGSSEVISAAAITNGVIFFAVRTKFKSMTWQKSRDVIYTFNYTGNLIDEINLYSGFIIPESAFSVLTIDEFGNLYSLRTPPYVFFNRIAYVDLNDMDYISGFNYFSSNLFVFDNLSVFQFH